MEKTLDPKCFPSMEEIELAPKVKLAVWCRFLIPKTENELSKIDKILSKFVKQGGWNAALSKRIGWDASNGTLRHILKFGK